MSKTIKSYKMKILLFVIVLLSLVSCIDKQINYDSLTSKACDSLLKTTALSSSERAKVIGQYALLNTPTRDNINQITNNKRDSCLNMLQEAISLINGNLRTDLQIKMLPFCISKLSPNNTESHRQIRNLMSNIENSNMTTLQEAWYLSYKTQYYILQQASKEAFELCEKARHNFRLNNDLHGEFNTLSQISSLYLLRKDYRNALHYCDMAQNLPNHQLSFTEQQKLYNQYSILYGQLGDYNKAIQACQKSGIDTIKNYTLIHLYIAANRYEEALKIIQKQEALRNDDTFRINYNLRIKAEIYEANGQYEKAASIREKAISMAEENSLKIQKKHPNIPGIPSAFAPIYAKQAAWVWKKGNKNKAIALLQKAEILSIRNNNIQKEDFQLLKQLSDYYKQMGNYHSAFITDLRYDSLQKIYDKSHDTSLYQEILAEHELEMLDATISKQKAEHRITNYSYIFIISSIILSLIIITLIVLYRRNLKRLRKKRNTHNLFVKDELTPNNDCE